MKTIEINYHRTKRRVPARILQELVNRVLKTEKGFRFRSLHYVFVDDKYMKEIHRRFLKLNTTTDVMAFDLAEESGGLVEAEIYINLDQASRQAFEFGVSFRNEALRLAAHGILHFLGYNDRTPHERTIMLERGEYFLQKLKAK